MVIRLIIIYLWSSLCLAQTTMIVPSAVGGQTDVIARILSSAYNQQNDNKILFNNLIP